MKVAKSSEQVHIVTGYEHGDLKKKNKPSVPSHLAWFSHRMAEANATKLKRAELKKIPGGPDSPIRLNDMPKDCPDF